jgi:hypothetical protein
MILVALNHGVTLPTRKGVAIAAQICTLMQLITLCIRRKK